MKATRQAFLHYQVQDGIYLSETLLLCADSYICMRTVPRIGKQKYFYCASNMHFYEGFYAQYGKLLSIEKSRRRLNFTGKGALTELNSTPNILY